MCSSLSVLRRHFSECGTQWRKTSAGNKTKQKGTVYLPPTSLPIQILFPSILSWWDLWCMGGMKMTSFICSCLDTEEREYHVCCELTCQKLKSKAWAAGRLNPSVCSHPDNDGNEAEDDDGAKVACPWTHPWHNTFLLHVSLLMAPFPASPLFPPLRIYHKRLHAPSVAVCFLSHWHHGAASAGSIPLNEPLRIAFTTTASALAGVA